MKTGLDFYRFDSPKMRELARACVAEYGRMIDKACKMAKRCGGTGEICVSSGIIRGFEFEKRPDSELWVRMDPNWNKFYRPRGARKVAEKLYREFKNLPKWNTDLLAEQVGWKNFCVDGQGGVGHYYMFNFFYSEKKKFYGFAVPKFSPSDYKKNPDAKYTPPKGLKKITAAQYERVMGPL
jgi:hypothetical protein